MALGVASCSQSPPTISVEEVEGTYRAASCPDIVIRGNLLLTPEGQTSYDLIRIKGDNILATASTPRVDLNGRCDLVVVPQPSYIAIYTNQHGLTVDLSSLDRSKSVRYDKVD